MASKIMAHTCINAGQDALHGRGMRVWNQTVKGFRCTACSGETSGGGIADTVKAAPKK